MHILTQIAAICNIIALFLGFLFALGKKRKFGWLIVLSFGIKVFFNFAGLISIALPIDMIYFLSFVATGTMLLALWRIYIRF